MRCHSHQDDRLQTKVEEVKTTIRTFFSKKTRKTFAVSKKSRTFAPQLRNRHTLSNEKSVNQKRLGKYQSGQMGQTVNLLAYAFGGSNPSLPTKIAEVAQLIEH